jgi:predicted MFS family arabinose efflux permease
MGLIGSGHGMSHFFQLTLPPLLPLLQADFALSYTELGLIVTVFAAAAAVAQMPVGFLVDRYGARAILICGLLVEALSIGAIAFAPTYHVILVLAALGGLGHSVFHPADYAIMVSSIEETRIGRAFSVHALTGSAGEMAAPAVLIFLTGLWNWHVALMVVAAVGVVVAAAMASQINILADDDAMRRRARTEKAQGAAGDHAAARPGGLRALLRPPILALFMFFLVTTMAAAGIKTFSVAALAAVHDTPVAVANAALTGYLIAAAVGVAVGGYVSDRTRRHDLIAAVAFLVTAAALALVGEARLGLAALVAVYCLVGVLQGMVRPARDVMVKTVTPKGTAGSIFAFMSTGRLLGGTATPVLLGWMIDSGGGGWVFWALAAFSVIGIATLYLPRGRTPSDGA